MGEYIPESQKAEDIYRIGANINKTAPHHESFKALWETKWKFPCSIGVYPFMFGSLKDFQPIVDNLIAKGFGEPYDWDAYANEFVPRAKQIEKAALKAEAAGEKEKAAEFFLRASAVYRISRFPTPRSTKQHHAWTLGKRAFLHGQSLLANPIRQVDIPHTHALPHEGKNIQAFQLLPSTASAMNPVPTIIIYTGLDGYRTELAAWAEPLRKRGLGIVLLEIPGTGDSPADRSDPTSPDRQMSSLLDWCDMQPGIDSKRLGLWGFSTGGYYSVRAAHTHRQRLKGAICLGGGVHHMFDKEWLDEVNHLEYPFDLAGALAYKFGYGTNLSKFKEEAHKFSLLNDGTLEKPCTRLLLVNGTLDEIFPVDDLYLLLQTGPSPKEARFIPNTKHMGEPASFGVCVNWWFDLFGLERWEGDVAELLKGLPFKAKFELPEHEVAEAKPAAAAAAAAEKQEVVGSVVEEQQGKGGFVVGVVESGNEVEVAA